MQRWGIGIPPSLSMHAIVTLARQAEEAGAESVWTADIGRDIFTPLTAIAQGTSRVRVGAAVAICFARPPALVQLAASDIDEMSQGRMVLGIGTAPPAWNENWYSVPKHEKPVARMKEFAQVCRLMWRSDPQHPVEFIGTKIQANTRKFSFRQLIEFTVRIHAAKIILIPEQFLYRHPRVSQINLFSSLHAEQI